MRIATSRSARATCCAPAACSRSSTGRGHRRPGPASSHRCRTAEANASTLRAQCALVPACCRLQTDLDAPPASARRLPHLPALLSLGLMVGTINGLSRVAMPLFAASRGAQAWQLGIVGGLGYMGVLLMALPMGAWIDRHGSRTMFLRGALAAALLYLLLLVVQGPWQVIAAAALLGFAL